MLTRRPLSFTVAICTFLAAPVAQGVIVGKDQTGATAPAVVSHVGSVSGASGVYLGNGWVLTARHISGGLIGPNTPFAVAGASYSAASTAVQITDPATGNPVDLQMFRLSTRPSLDTLDIPASSPVVGTPITMAGFGRSPRDASPTYYNVTDATGDPEAGGDTNPSNNPDLVWTETNNSVTSSDGGYKYSPNGQALRWGTNLTSLVPGTNPPSTTATYDLGTGRTVAFASNFFTNKTEFTAGGGTLYEAQASAGDSGGGVFDSAGDLRGIMGAVGNFNEQPGNLAAFGNLTYMIDLSVYRQQITATMVPEPSALALLTAGGALLARRPRRSAR